MTSTLKHPRLSIFLAMVFCMPLVALAQDQRPPMPPPDSPTGQPGQQAKTKPDLLRELGLSREQMQAIRKLNIERKPLEQEARRRFQDANRDLNMAIYADNASDETVQARLKEFQTAQAELARIKFTNELAVRRLLTPDQLDTFRTLRQRFAETRENIEKRRGDSLQQPGFRRLRRGNQPPPIN